MPFPPIHAPLIVAAMQAQKKRIETKRDDEWRAMSTAPRDGTVIRLKVGRYRFRAHFGSIGAVDKRDRDCASWIAEAGEKYPPCWTDGYMWGSNADELPSKAPDGWRTT